MQSKLHQIEVSKQKINIFYVKFLSFVHIEWVSNWIESNHEEIKFLIKWLNCDFEWWIITKLCENNNDN